MLFGAVIFLSALLLFQVQLIVSKHLLPWFGGTPAVWTTSQMFFQVSLLGGYTYAHVLTMLRPVRQYRIHVTMLLGASAVLFGVAIWGGAPILAPDSMRPTEPDGPAMALLLVLAVSVGLPFFAVCTTGPLLQRWHSRLSGSLDRTYRLYALSNAGSFLGLLSYPVLVERQLNLSEQAWSWAALFALFAVGCSVVAGRARHFPESGPTTEPRHEAGTDDSAASAFGEASLQMMGVWLLLSLIGSVTFLATTNELTHDVAAVPFLWALPLALYLLTFIICFDRPHWYSRRWMPIVAALACIAVLPNITNGLRVPWQIVAYSAFLFSFCMLCHGELVRLRPGVRQLTLFYLLVALGGALGGIFVSLCAPALFDDFWEFQLVVPVGWTVIGIAWWTDRRSPFHAGERWLFASLITISLWFAIRYPIERTRFGHNEWLATHGWSVTLLGGAVLGAGICAALWRTRLARSSLWPRAMLLLLVVTFSLFLQQSIEKARHGALYAARSFYGVVRVVGDTAGAAEVRRLMHGTTVHGVQLDVLGRSTGPTAYYSPSTGIAIASTELVRASPGIDERPATVHLGVVGMGVGTMTAFARAGDRVRYYEINPDVIDIAQGPYFTFVRNSPGDVTIVAGDARLSLERELREPKPQQFDLLAIDAFSSDSVPVHLITLEAFRVYAAHLNTHESILAVNVTNRYLDLEPVVAANARALGLHAVRVDSDGDQPVVLESSWILMARNPGITEHPAVLRAGGRPLRDGVVSFTDRYSNLFRVLK